MEIRVMEGRRREGRKVFCCQPVWVCSKGESSGTGTGELVDNISFSTIHNQLERGEEEGQLTCFCRLPSFVFSKHDSEGLISLSYPLSPPYLYLIHTDFSPSFTVACINLVLKMAEICSDSMYDMTMKFRSMEVKNLWKTAY